MADYTATQDALLEAIKKAAETAHNLPVSVKGSAIRDLAYAYRAVKGGAQPGGLFVEDK